ncbi:hypothetical protein LV75_005158 [Actinokineospora diospyrosa]|uniref:Uncharacterized protein n=1 Tax=Actinokineospora diospyrosa TaxID=103728 RepID=A0ABT1IJ06_9PSEU|nr:hypothetical protein [Actinokineospora diospyrosa]
MTAGVLEQCPVRPVLLSFSVDERVPLSRTTTLALLDTYAFSDNGFTDVTGFAVVTSC